jgi:spore germination protein GerM
MAVWWLLALLLGCGGSETAAPTPAPAAQGAKTKAKAPADPKKAAKAKAREAALASNQEKTEIKVFFLDREVMEAGGEDYLVAVDRFVGAKTPHRHAIYHVFKGPDDDEEGKGLSAVRNGAKGFKDLKIADGVATLKLRDGCEPAEGKVSVYDLIHKTLTSFDDVQFVKLLDPEGNTTTPDGKSDSKPACLGG